MHSCRSLELCDDCPTGEFYASILLGSPVTLCNKLLARLKTIREIYLELARRGRIYGFSTGVGALQTKKLTTISLSERLVYEHAAGTGPYLPEDVSRLVYAVRLVQITRGYSPVRPSTVEKMAEYMKRGIVPAIPVYGSVGASGDLAPLAHIVYSLMGKGFVWYKGRLVESRKALDLEGLEPLRLEEGEALSLINGTAYSTGILIYASLKLLALLQTWARIIGFSIGLATCSIEHYEYETISIKMHDYPPEILSVIEEAVRSYADTGSCKVIQDPYSLRCTPQIISAFHKTLISSATVALCEACSPSDNPVITRDGSIRHQCSFHGIHVALAADQLAIAISALANNAERRISQLLDKDTTRISKSFLGDEESPSGYMIAQYTAAARAAYLRHLAMPHSVHNIPTSLLQEDVVSMSANASLRLLDAIEALLDIVSIELVLAIRLAYLKSKEPLAEYKHLLETVNDSRKALSEIIMAARRAIEHKVLEELSRIAAGLLLKRYSLSCVRAS